jgi:hypothetical protein
MAGDWIKMRMDLTEDPAVYKLSSLLKLDRFAVVGRLYAFWAWADRHAVDGRVDGGASTVVDDIVRCDGFAAAMVAVKWLEIGDDFVSIPNHDRHNGESAKERSLKNARQARWREKKDASVGGPVDGGASTKASTREEKRREDIDTPASPKSRKPIKTPLPADFGISERVRTWAAEKKHGNLDRHFENFISACKRNGYTYADWDEALMEAIRSDWAKIGGTVVQASDKFKGAK